MTTLRLSSPAAKAMMSVIKQNPALGVGTPSIPELRILKEMIIGRDLTAVIAQEFFDRANGTQLVELLLPKWKEIQTTKLPATANKHSDDSLRRLITENLKIELLGTIGDDIEQTTEAAVNRSIGNFLAEFRRNPDLYAQEKDVLEALEFKPGEAHLDINNIADNLPTTLQALAVNQFATNLMNRENQE